MNTVSRRTILLGLAGIGAATLAGCGRDDSQAGAAGSPAPPVSGGKASGEITMWAMGAEGAKLPSLLKQFQAENPDVNVKVTAIPWNSAHAKFTSAIAAQTAPDLAMVGTTWMGEFVNLGALEPTPSDLIDPSRFFEGPWGGTVVKGTSYGVPWYVETRLVFYRTDLAEKAGAQPATDWDSLKALATAYQKRAGAEWGIGLQPGQTGSWQTVMPFAWSNGARLINDDATKFTFDTPETTEAVEYYQSFFVDGLSNKSPTTGRAEADFVSGEVPMFISGPWEMSAVEELGGKGFADKYAVSLFPEKKTSTSFVGGADLAVFKGTKNRDAAWKLVQFLTTTETQVAWYKTSTDLPSVKDAWDDPALSSDKKLAVFGEQLKSTVSPPTVPTWEQVAAEFDAQMEKVCKAGLDPAQAMKTVQQQASSIGTGL